MWAGGSGVHASSGVAPRHLESAVRDWQVIEPIAYLGLGAGALLVVLFLMVGRQTAKFGILIEASPQIVWERWIIACGNNDWRPLAEIESVETLSRSPLTIKVKATEKGLAGLSSETTWRYDVYEPYRRYRCRVISGGGTPLATATTPFACPSAAANDVRAEAWPAGGASLEHDHQLQPVWIATALLRGRCTQPRPRQDDLSRLAVQVLHRRHGAGQIRQCPEEVRRRDSPCAAASRSRPLALLALLARR